MTCRDGLTVLVDKGQATDVTYLDTREAFDTVPGDVAASELEGCGSGGWPTRSVRNRPSESCLMSEWRPVMRGLD